MGTRCLKYPWICLLFMLAACCVPGLGRNAENANSGMEFKINPTVIMQRVRDSLPRIPVLISGQLRSGPLRGGFKRSYQVEMRLDMSRRPISASYILRDQFGAIIEQLLVTRYGPDDVDLQYRRASGSATLDLDGKILDTDITWGDLSLNFLWWPDARLVGKDTFRGRDCVVLDLVPSGSVNSRQTRRLWVDENIYAFLQMEARVDGKPVRRLMTRSFKKIGEHWMVKDMEMRSLTRSHRTLLRVDEMSELAEADFSVEDNTRPPAATPEEAAGRVESAGYK